MSASGSVSGSSVSAVSSVDGSELGSVSGSVLGSPEGSVSVFGSVLTTAVSPALGFSALGVCRQEVKRSN